MIIIKLMKAPPDKYTKNTHTHTQHTRSYLKYIYNGPVGASTVVKIFSLN